MQQDDVTQALLREMLLAIRENTAELRALRGDQIADTVGTEDACRILRVSPNTLAARVRAGEIRKMRHGKRVLYSKRDLNEYLRRQSGA